MVTRESPRRTRLLASGLLVLTFAVGALAGAATLKATDSDRRPRQERGSNREGRGNNSDNRYNTRRQPSVFFQSGIFDSLGATPQQKQAIEAILDRRDREVNALYAQIRPSVEAVRKQTWGEMTAQLTAEQQGKLKQIMDDRRERWQKDRQQHNQDNNNKPRP